MDKPSQTTIKNDLYFLRNKSPQAAKKLKTDILNSTKNILFSEQYQQDEIQSDFRRIIVGNYKILYKEYEGIIFIARIFDTRQNPEKYNK